MKLLFGAVAVLAAIGCSGAASAATIKASNPQSVIKAMNDLGYEGKLGKTSTGRPQMVTKVNGSTTAVDFYDCTDDFKECQTLLFSNGLDLPDGTDTAKANEWNSTKIYGRVYIDDEDDPWMEMLLVTGDGIPTEVFEHNLAIWETELPEFKDFFGFTSE